MTDRTPQGDGYALQILALAGDIKDVRTQLDDLAGIGAALTGLADAVTAVELKVDNLAAAESEQPIRMWDWTTMDTDQAQVAWNVLLEWVEKVLVGTYNAVSAREMDQSDPKIPACWYRHPNAVAELSWLCQEWMRIYRTSKGTPGAAGEWHDRWLPGVLRRLSRSMSACADYDPEHQDHKLGIPVDDREAFWEMVGADLDGRPKPPTPKTPK